MVSVALKCPFCGNEDVKKYGRINSKQRYACKNADCKRKTFYADYTYKGCKPEIKQDIIRWSVDGAGIRAIARELGISTDTVISELKKKRI
jgi:transposase-like protein